MSSVTERGTTYVGGEVKRREDASLLTGRGTYVDNMQTPGQLVMHLVRSPVAHARIGRVDTSAAAKASGVAAVYTMDDLADGFAGPLPMAWPVTDDIVNPPHWPLARDKVRYQGDAVAVVLAETRAQATDAADLVEVDYDPLDAVVSVEAALADGAPIVHEDAGTNRCYQWELANGDRSAFDAAPVKVTERIRNNRLIPNAIEPRGVVAQATPGTGEVTLWSSTQIPHIAKTTLSMCTGIPESKLRIIAPDVGGGFGSKLNVYAEEALALVLAGKLGRPIKWTEARSENYQATIHGRDHVTEITLAAREDGTLVGIDVEALANMGAYLQLLTPGIPILGAFNYCGIYNAEYYRFNCTGVFTTTTPTDAYRGAGRPEATYAIERAMDRLAGELGQDPIELRRKNFLPDGELITTPAGIQYDSINYGPAVDRALAMADYDGVRDEQRRRREAGDTKLLGIGVSTYCEICGLAPSQVVGALKLQAGLWDRATVRMLPTGKVEAVTGTSPHGQGHETSWSQIVADDLGVTPDDVTVLHGDTAIAPFGMDTYGSRSLAVGGVAVHLAAEQVRDKARRIAAHLLEVDPDDLQFDGGTFSVAGAPDKSMGIGEVALAAWTAHDMPEGEEPVLEESYSYDPANFTFPFGTHICTVEVDRETGEIDVRDYVAVDDCGTIINPQIVEGQLHGGIAQGLAQAWYEEAIYDDVGNLLTGNMATYSIPAAPELPSVRLDRTVTPSPTNPLGVKGVGEAGTIASPPAFMNAVIDALSHLGVTTLDMPASPERVWRAIRAAGQTQFK